MPSIMIAISKYNVVCLLLRFIIGKLTVYAQTTASSPTSTLSLTPVIQNAPSPTISPTKQTISNIINLTIDDIKLTFYGISNISSADVLGFQTTMGLWFEAYYNEEIEQRHLHPYHMPAIDNMNTIVYVTAQNVTELSNIITYTQTMGFDPIGSESGNPANYLLLPFVNISYNNELKQRVLSEFESFINLVAISTPLTSQSTLGDISTNPVLSTPTTSPKIESATDDDDDDIGSILAFVGLAIIAVFGVVTRYLCFISFFQDKWDEPASSTNNVPSAPVESSAEHITNSSVYPNATSTIVSTAAVPIVVQESVRYVPATFVDAIPYPDNVLYNDDSATPIATFVTYREA